MLIYLLRLESVAREWMDSLPSRFVNELPEEGIEKNEDRLKDTLDDFDFNQDSLLRKY